MEFTGTGTIHSIDEVPGVKGYDGTVLFNVGILEDREKENAKRNGGDPAVTPVSCYAKVNLEEDDDPKTGIHFGEGDRVDVSGYVNLRVGHTHTFVGLHLRPEAFVVTAKGIPQEAQVSEDADLNIPF